VGHCDRLEWSEAADLLNQALPVLGAAGDHETRCRAWGLLGLIHLRRHEFVQSREYLQRCIRLADESGLLVDGTYARSVLAEWYTAQKANDRARELLATSLRMLRACGDRNGEVWILGAMARLFASEERFDEALEVAEESVRVSASVGNAVLAAQRQSHVDELRVARVRQLQPHP
jgi:tetratricopeptide (TPR) repeat protein